MEVKPGYKQTEVGIFPADWEIEPLGKHATFRTGPFGSALHKSDYTDDGIPVVNPMHIVDGKIEPTRTMTITEHAAKGLSEFRMKPGEIIIGRRGDMGRCTVVQKHQLGWLCGTGAMIVRPLNTDAEFLQRVLSSPRAISAIEESSVGTTMVNLNQGTLAGLKIQIPPRSEQRAIAAALSDVDALLGGLDRLITKKRDLKKAAMQQLLTGQTRLPGFNGEWEVKTLGQITQLKNGYAFKSETYNPTGDFKIVTIANVQDGYMDTAECSRISELPSDIQPHQKLKLHDILISMTGNVGRVCRVNDTGCLLNQRVGKVLATGCNDGLLFRLLSQRQFLSAMATKAKGGAQGNLSVSDIMEFQFPVPPTDSEQTAIAAVLSDMDAELWALETRRDKTRDLKQAMMQELLTGKTRLVPAGGADA